MDLIDVREEGRGGGLSAGVRRRFGADMMGRGDVRRDGDGREEGVKVRGRGWWRDAG